MSFSLVPVTGKDFVNREELLNEMEETFKTSNIGFALYGNRRIGKSSVFRELCSRLSKSEEIVPVYINIWKLVEESLEEFAKVLSGSVLDAYKDKIGLQYRAKELLKSSVEVSTKIIRNLKLGIKTQDEIAYFFSLGKEEKKDVAELVKRAFNLSEKLAEETKTKCVLFIDEFPSIIDLKRNGSKAGEQIVKFIRSLFEEQKKTILCVSGSIRSTMEAVVIDSNSAFYKQLIVKEVKPLEKKFVDKIIKKNLTKEISEDGLDELYRITRGVPFYVHLLGKKLQVCKGKIDEKEVRNSFDQLLKDEGTVLFKADIEKLSPKQKVVAVAMALGDLSVLSEIADAARVSHGSIGTIMKQLEDKGVVIRIAEGKYELEDHFFKTWLARRYAD